jgi:hypothetical protein
LWRDFVWHYGRPDGEIDGEEFMHLTNFCSPELNSRWCPRDDDEGDREQKRPRARGFMEKCQASVRNVISGSGNRSDPRPDRGRLPCMAVGPLSHIATIKGGQAGAREPTFTMPTVPPQTLTT